MKATNTCGLLLLHPYHSPAPPRLILHHHHHREQPQENWPPPVQLSSTSTTSTCNHHHHHLLVVVRTLHICRSRRWYSNAESYRHQNFNYDFDEDDDEDTENDDSSEQWAEVLEDCIESIWIFKVFRSYGWALPFVIISILLTTGLKAFLMALALPLGQSTFSFAFQKTWEGKENRPKRKAKTKKRSHVRSSRTVKEMKERKVGSQGKRKAKRGYQSWVPGLDDSTDPVAKNGPTFSGWDELDRGREFDVRASSSSAQSVDRSEKSPSEKSRLGMSIRKSDTPLLLRLLIAVFPFLSSWTKML